MTNPVTITVELTFKPEATDAFCGGLPDMLKETAKQHGFRSIQVLRNKENRNQVLFVESWDSEEAYSKYIAWRTERGDMEAMGPLVAEPPKFGVWPTVVASAGSADSHQ